MAVSKKKDSISPLRRLGAWLLGPGRTGLVIVVMFGVFIGAAWLAWIKLQPRIVVASEYRIGPEQVEVTLPPAWIHTDIRAAVFRSPTLDGSLSLLDADLVPRITNAFAAHPWVAKVTRVSKHHPASVKVGLVYRKPVCMVKVPRGLLPVDAEGVLLPSEDFSPTEAATQYLAVRDVDREPTSPVGSRWGDARALGGAEIAAAIGDVWKQLRLYSIVPQTEDPASGTGRLSEPVFWITTSTRGASRIFWGYAPGANAPNDLPAAEKVARLKRYFLEHDTFDGPQGQRQDLDIRSMPPSVRP